MFAIGAKNLSQKGGGSQGLQHSSERERFNYITRWHVEAAADVVMERNKIDPLFS